MVTGNKGIFLNATQKISIVEVEQSTPEKYILSINLRIDGLSFLIQNHKHEIVHMEYFEWLNVIDWGKTIVNTTSLIKNHDLLSLTFPKVKVFIQSPDNFLLPHNLYNEKGVVEIYNQYLGISTHEVFNSKYNDSSFLIFGVHQDLVQTLNTKWNCSWDHCSKFYLSQSFSSASNGQELFLKFHQNYFEIIAFNSKVLEAHNYFNYSSADEFIFNLLSFTKQIGMDVSSLKIHLSGKIIKTSNLFELVNKYYPNVLFEEDENQTEYASFTPLINAANYENS